MSDQDKHITSVYNQQNRLLYQYPMFRRVKQYVEENYTAVILISYSLDGFNSMKKKTIQLLYQYPIV